MINIKGLNMILSCNRDCFPRILFERNTIRFSYLDFFQYFFFYSYREIINLVQSNLKFGSRSKVLTSFAEVLIGTNEIYNNSLTRSLLFLYNMIRKEAFENILDIVKNFFARHTV